MQPVLGGLRRGAAGVDADCACVHAGGDSGWRMRLLKQRREFNRGCGERVCRRARAGSKAWKQRAGGVSGDERRRSGAGFGHHRGHAHCHRAMVCAVTPAAGRQACVVAARERRSEGSQPEIHRQKDGKRAPHLLHGTRGLTRLAGRCADLHRRGAPGRLSSETSGIFNFLSVKLSRST